MTLRRNALVQILCALMLLIAQREGLSHQIWHLGIPGSQAEVSGEKQQDPVKSTLCDLHASFSAVLGAASGSVPMPPPGTLSHPYHVRTEDRVASFHAPVPASRGPPELL